jgi:hypothetical protein
MDDAVHVTLARQPTTVKPLGGKGAGQAGCIAAPLP